MTSPPKALIVDLDGLLIDSEPLWRAVGLRLFTGLGLPLTEERMLETMGLRIDEDVAYWHARYPWTHPSQGEVAAQWVQGVIELVEQQGQAKPGLEQLLAIIREGEYPAAIASSSPESYVAAVVRKLGIAPYFPVVHSAEHEPYGKPHPGVFITAARRLGVAPERCIVLEDSPNGVLAAKAARMACVAVPDPLLQTRKEFCLADLVLPSLADLAAAALEAL